MPDTGGRWRALLSALCIAIAAILVPVSIVGAWVRAELVDESQFVATFAPLAQNPQVQDLIIDQSLAAIHQNVQFDQLTGSVIDGIEGLGLSRQATSALNLLRRPAADGVRALVDGSVTKVVQSDAFAAIWSNAVRDAHRALVGTATPDSGALVGLTDAGLGIRLGPLVAQVKQRLTDQGVGVAALIPTVDRTIIIGSGDAVVTMQVAYKIALAAGWWPPALTLGLFAVGVFLARRRSLAVLWSGIALVLGGGLLLAAFSAGSIVVSAAAGNAEIAPAALTAIYETLVRPIAHIAVLAVTLGVFVAILGWALGDWSPSRRLRGVVGGLNRSARHDLQERGLDTGRFGGWLSGHRVLVRAVVGLLAVVWLVLLPSLSFGDIVLIVVLALLGTWALELLQKRPDELVSMGARPTPSPI